MKKNTKIIIFVMICCTIFIMVYPHFIVANDGQDEIFEELDQNVQTQLDKLDLTDIDELLSQLGVEQQKLFGQTTFKDKIESVLNGDFVGDSNSFIEAFFNLLFSEIINILPILVSIAIISILCGLISQMKSGFMSDSTSQIVFFVCFAMVVVLALICVSNLIDITKDAIENMKSQMNFAFPILLTLMAGIGGTVSVKAYQPAVALLSGGVVEIVSNIILPMFIFTIVFSVVGNLSKSVRLTKLTDFFKSSSTTILIVTFTIFTAFLSIQGLTAGTFDSVSIRAAKFATKSYVPILGGYLADGFDLILASSVLIKNSVGVAGLILLICTILSPVLQILAVCFGFKIVAAVVEPVTDNRITSFLSTMSKHLNMLIVAILAVAFMYFICVMLLIFTSNAFF